MEKHINKPEDKEKEQALLESLEACKSPVDRHLYYVRLQEYYFDRRGLGQYFIDSCKKYCSLDVSSLENPYMDGKYAFACMETMSKSNS